MNRDTLNETELAADVGSAYPSSLSPLDTSEDHEDRDPYAAIDAAEARAERAIWRAQGVPVSDCGIPFSF